MEISKIFNCSCQDGFTGDFCEFKTEQDHLLFIRGNIQSLFNANGRLIGEKAIVDEQIGADGSCATILHGEAVIFGGSSRNLDLQVRFIYC